jgi:hypothetical protein
MNIVMKYWKNLSAITSSDRSSSNYSRNRGYHSSREKIGDTSITSKTARQAITIGININILKKSFNYLFIELSHHPPLSVSI